MTGIKNRLAEGKVMPEEITLVDRGRGLQLSTSRITVQDLVHYFQRGCSYEEIMRWIPCLTPEEIGLIEAYYRGHREELDEKERRVMAYRQEQMRLQRLRFPPLEGTREEKMAVLRQRLQQYLQRKNGAATSGGQ
jgi:uncharacterized protein (DUF433 family)